MMTVMMVGMRDDVNEVCKLYGVVRRTRNDLKKAPLPLVVLGLWLYERMKSASWNIFEMPIE